MTTLSPEILDQLAGQAATTMAVGNEHASQPMLVLRKGRHLTPLQLHGADYLPAIEGRDEVRETVRILRPVEPLQFLFQCQAGLLAPLRVVPLRQLLPFRRIAGKYVELHP